MPVGLVPLEEGITSTLRALIYNMIRVEVQKQVSLLTNEIGNSQSKFYDIIKQKIDYELQKIEQYCIDEKLEPNFKSLTDI
jgi:hypothetical protein